MMNTIRYFKAGTLITPFDCLRHASMEISAEGLIQSVSGDRSKDEFQPVFLHPNGNIVLPGLIDIHVHGGYGVTFGVGNLLAGLKEYSKFAASHGVTGFLLSISGPNAGEISGILREYADILEKTNDWPGALPLGFHLEGPFLNRSRHGAFNPDWIHNPSIEEAKAFLEAGRGWIRHISMAPELPGAEDTARFLSECGVVVSLGHSDASYLTADSALKGAYSHITHTFNAQSPLHQREPGVVGAVLSSATATAELIGDGVHVHPAVMKILYRCLGAERIVLITDAMSGAGLPDGDYELLNQKVKVINGRATLPDGTIGGSTGTLEICLQNMVNLVGVSLPEAARMATLNPSKVIGYDNRIGSLEPGKEANFIVMDHNNRIRQTVIKGNVVYSVDGEV